MALSKIKSTSLETDATNLVLLNSASGSTAVAQVDIDSTYITSAYDDYLLITHFQPATDASTVRLRLFSGGSVQSGASDYGYGYARTDTTSTVGTNDESYVPVGIDSGNLESEGQKLILHLLDVNTTVRRTRGYYHFNSSNLSDNHGGGVGDFQCNFTSAIDGIRFYFDSGNISNYQYKIYGVKG